jgi:hypothetical protein
MNSVASKYSCGCVFCFQIPAHSHVVIALPTLIV